MKKLLIGLTILFSFLMFSNNVSALQGANIEPVTTIYNHNFRNVFLGKIQETGSFLYYKNTYNEKYYFGLGNWYINASNRNALTLATDYPELISFTTNIKENDNTAVIVLSVKYDPNKPVYFYYYDGSYSQYNVNKITTDGTNLTFTNYNNSYNSAGILITEDSSYYLSGPYDNLYNTYNNVGYSLTKENDVNYFFTTNYDGAIYYKKTDYLNSYNTLYFEKDNLLINDNMPLIYNYSMVTTETILETKIDITLLEKTDYLEKIKINFNRFDKDKYNYQYKLIGMEVWENIDENDFEYISYSNNTIYIQVVDKSNNEIIKTATYTFSNITETIPDITFNESIPNSCKVLKNGTNYIVCKEIKANFNNYYGINNYLWNYSVDSENWTQIYNDKFIDLISENKAIYFKLYDRNTNEILKYMTYNITGIELIPSDLGQYITFNGKYENNNYKLDIIFYNYDNELYNYYYSTDGENWTQLNIGELSNYTSIYSKYKSFNFYKDMTIYVKIEDKEANYITSATYEIKIPNVGLFDTINNFKVDNNILNYFTNIYNQIRTSDLGNYVFILIVTSIILLIIKSARR